MAKTGSILLNLVDLAPQKTEDIIKFFDDTDKILQAQGPEFKSTGQWHGQKETVDGNPS